jgi:hypothetical protein
MNREGQRKGLKGVEVGNKDGARKTNKRKGECHTYPQ